ncbi:MAG: hypothetical protein ACFFHV_23270, partial [Promethearchaeota archaeon]
GFYIMNQIYWIYIIDDRGATIFSYETTVQGSLRNNHAIISHFLHALQSIGKNLGDNEVKSIDLGNNRFYLTKEKLTNYLFIIKTDTNADFEFINLLLKQIMFKFVEKFTGHFKLVVDEKIELINSFKEDIKEILRYKSKFEKFSETLQEA